MKLRALSTELASATACAARSGTFATRSPPTLTVADPRTAPRRIGPSTSCGARIETVARCPRRTPTLTDRAARSGSLPSS